jgi:hypothetical protein
MLPVNYPIKTLEQLKPSQNGHTIRSIENQGEHNEGYQDHYPAGFYPDNRGGALSGWFTIRPASAVLGADY